MEFETLLYINVSMEIERKIIDGVYQIGDKLPSERELTTEHQVSRNVIRQAITILREKGLVIVKSGKGSYVTSPKDHIVSDSLTRVLQKYDTSFEDILEVREELEISIIKKAVKRSNSASIEQLKNVFNTMEANKNNVNIFLEQDMNFHVTIANSSQNPIFSILIGSFFQMTEKLPFTVTNITNQYIHVFNKAQEDHWKLIEAIEAKDEKLAVAVMKEHMNIVNEEVKVLKNSNLI
jgi:DNA-binding FadR family transcriptional regulator